MSPLVAGPTASTAATQFPHLTASNSLSTLSNYYSNNNSSSKENNDNNNNNNNTSNGPASPRRSPSPTLNPGSPEGRSERSNSQSDTEDTIQV